MQSISGKEQPYFVWLPTNQGDAIEFDASNTAEAKFEQFLFLATQLGDGYSEAQDLRDTSEIIKIHLVVSAVESELDGKESEHTDVIEIEGRDYFRTKLSIGAVAFYRSLERSELSGTALTEEENGNSAVHYFLAAIDLNPDNN